MIVLDAGVINLYYKKTPSLQLALFLNRYACVEPAPRKRELDYLVVHQDVMTPAPAIDAELFHLPGRDCSPSSPTRTTVPGAFPVCSSRWRTTSGRTSCWLRRPRKAGATLQSAQMLAFYSYYFRRITCKQYRLVGGTYFSS